MIDCQLDRPKKINQMNPRTPEIRDGHLTDNTLHLEGISAKSIFTYWDATHSEQKRRENRSLNSATQEFSLMTVAFNATPND